MGQDLPGGGQGGGDQAGVLLKAQVRETAPRMASYLSLSQDGVPQLAGATVEGRVI